MDPSRVLSETGNSIVPPSAHPPTAGIWARLASSMPSLTSRSGLGLGLVLSLECNKRGGTRVLLASS
ncbi:MAG: hypothetical protein ACK56I_04745 [bacterium]